MKRSVLEKSMKTICDKKLNIGNFEIQIKMILFSRLAEILALNLWIKGIPPDSDTENLRVYLNELHSVGFFDFEKE